MAYLPSAVFAFLFSNVMLQFFLNPPLCSLTTNGRAPLFVLAKAKQSSSYWSSQLLPHTIVSGFLLFDGRLPPIIYGAAEQQEQSPITLFLSLLPSLDYVPDLPLAIQLQRSFHPLDQTFLNHTGWTSMSLQHWTWRRSQDGSKEFAVL